MTTSYASVEERKAKRNIRPSDVAVPSGTGRQRGTDPSSNMGISEERRTPAQKDLDAILYSYYTRRLARITQVSSNATAQVSPRSMWQRPYSLSHNRLTHSLKVAQVARRLAQYLLQDDQNAKGIEVAGGLEPDVAELAGRAHDLGHPPFGHIGEQVLDQIAVQNGLPDGFEGNAQSFRILTFLQRKLRDGRPVQGMNLTNVSTASIVKYPWSRGDSGKKYRKFNYYDIDIDRFTGSVSPLLYCDDSGILEAQIMDWADDISYATHDIEDFALAGVIPLHRLTFRPEGNKYVPVDYDEFNRFWKYASTYLSDDSDEYEAAAKRSFMDVAGRFFLTELDDSEQSRDRMRAFASYVITETSLGTSVDPSTGCLLKTPEVAGLVDIMKRLTWYYVIDRPETTIRQRGEKKVLESVVLELLAWSKEAYSEEEHVASRNGRQTRQRTGTEQSEIRNGLDSTLRESINRSIEDYRDRHRSGSVLQLTDEERKEAGLVRGVIDYVAGLTEEDIYAYHHMFELGYVEKGSLRES